MRRIDREEALWIAGPPLLAAVAVAAWRTYPKRGAPEPICCYPNP